MPPDARELAISAAVVLSCAIAAIAVLTYC